MNFASAWSSICALVPRSARSIRGQLVLWNVLTLAALLVALQVVTHYLVGTYMMAGVDAHLRARTQGFTERILREGAGRHPGRVFRFGGPGGPFVGPSSDGASGPGRRDGGPGQDPPRLFDVQGRPVVPGGSDPWDRRALAVAVRGRDTYTNVETSEGVRRVLSRPIRVKGAVQQVVQVALPMEEVQMALRELRRALLVLTPIALLAAAGGGLFLTNRVLRPVGALSDAVGRIGAADLSERLPIVGHDEFAALAAKVNGMLARVETAFAEQQRLVERQRRFVADASHELRTPLTVVKGATSLCRSGRPTLEEYEHTIAEIDRAAASMASLVQDLLVLAQSDGGQLGRDPITLPIREVLEEAAASVERPAQIVLELEVEEGALCVLGVQTELRRLFANLLDNAMRYSPTGGLVKVRARRDGSEAVVSVADTGVGIAPEHVEHLGERFYRADASRSRGDGGGAGLGLSICRSILEAHGGAMQIESEPGKGTTVVVRLPAA